MSIPCPSPNPIVLMKKRGGVTSLEGGSVGEGATKPDDLSSNPGTYKVGEKRLLKVVL